MYFLQAPAMLLVRIEGEAFLDKCQACVEGRLEAAGLFP